MGTVRFTPLSRSDLKEIRDFIAQDNPKIAAKYMMMLKQKCDLLANSPGLGEWDSSEDDEAYANL